MFMWKEDLRKVHRPGWKYDSWLDFWAWGDLQNGCGVGTDDGEHFWVNVVYDNGLIMYGTCDSLEEAMEKAERGFTETHTNYRS